VRRPALMATIVSLKDHHVRTAPSQAVALVSGLFPPRYLPPVRTLALE